jgi:hypothetical protein
MTVLINGTNGLIQAYDYQVPTTGFSYTFAAGTQTLVMNPAGTLATGTITMPTAPSDGMTITFSTTKQITALTLNGGAGQTVVGGVSYLPANTSVSYMYRTSNTSWFPLQAVPLLATQPLGYGQTWQNVVGSRVSGTTYTNSTGRPIFVAVCTTQWLASAAVDSIGIAVTGTNNVLNVSFVVPAGSTYSATVGGGSINIWSELR